MPITLWRKPGEDLEIEMHNVALEEDSVTIDPELVPGNYVKVTVSDTGKGISPQIIDRIFDPFLQPKRSEKVPVWDCQ